jgi:argininosuccinate lyase
MTLEEMQAFSPLFDGDVFDAISIHTCVVARDVPGGPAPDRVLASIESAEARLQDGSL